ncbi:MAG: rubrerythrin family protein [Firmicutes bacterium]|nr:rubrerythrin family protein [Candidatus Caballimonas caccae]
MRESSAFMDYFFYSVVAKQEGYEQLYKIFNQIADNEKAHAEIWFKLYHKFFDTKTNLLNSADLERYEYSEMYKEFSSIATKEGFDDIAFLFDGVAKIEKDHEKTFKNLANCLENKCVFKKEKEVQWKCANCGNIVTGKSAPDTCPICSHPTAYFFELKN